jgi:hypothetical protein
MEIVDISVRDRVREITFELIGRGEALEAGLNPEGIQRRADRNLPARATDAIVRPSELAASAGLHRTARSHEPLGLCA